MVTEMSNEERLEQLLEAIKRIVFNDTVGSGSKVVALKVVLEKAKENE